MKKKPINKYRRKITDEKELKAINRLLFTKGKQRYQLYCRYLYSEKYLTRYDVHINLWKGTLEFWNVTSDRLVAIDLFNPKAKKCRVMIAQKIRQRLSPLGVKFSRKVWSKRNV